jgi:hypothetical protein
MQLRTPILWLCGLLWALFGGPYGSAFAQESLDDLDAAKKGDSGARSSPQRSMATWTTAFSTPLSIPNASLLSTVNQPSLQEILEGNIQLKISFGAKAVCLFRCLADLPERLAVL